MSSTASNLSLLERFRRSRPRSGRAGIGAAWLGGLALLTTSLTSSCQAPAIWVHPDLRQLDADTVGLWRVENSTVQPLDRVSFGGALQRGLLAPRTFDIPGLLSASLRHVLEKKGYETKALGEFPAEGWRAPVVGSALDGVAGAAAGPPAAALADGDSAAAGPAGAEGAVGDTPLDADLPPPAVAARLRCRIVAWTARTGSLASFHMTFRVEVDSGSAAPERRLYGGEFQASYRESGGSRRSHEAIPGAMLAAAGRALAAWPNRQ